MGEIKAVKYSSIIAPSDLEEWYLKPQDSWPKRKINGEKLGDIKAVKYSSIIAPSNLEEWYLKPQDSWPKRQK